MNLVNEWFRLVSELRGAFKRKQTFNWVVLILMGLSTRFDLAGVTSFMRCLGLKTRCYNRLLDCFHSTASDLKSLSQHWVRTVLKTPSLLRVNERIVLVGDGVKAPKSGKKMPGVKTLHQESDNNSKSEFILGHSCQSVSVLAGNSECTLAVPLTTQIHEGVIFDKKKKVSLLDKMVTMIQDLKINEPFYFVLDAYYAAKNIVEPFLKEDNHIITRLKHNAVAFQPYQSKTPKKGAGRKKLYGTKLHLEKLFLEAPHHYKEASSPVYGEKNVTIRYISTRLLWRPIGKLVQYIAVIHPVRGKILLMCTDTRLSALEVIKLYALRYKIELGFKNSKHTIGAFAYHFWMKCMRRIKKWDGDQDVSQDSEAYQNSVRRKLTAYQCHLQLGAIAQGLLQLISIKCKDQVWQHFGSWLRTIRPNVLPSEMVTRIALQNALPEFLASETEYANLQKFWRDNIDYERSEGLRLAA